MPAPWLALGVLLTCIATFVAVHLFIGRRRFYRTNAAGVQEFKSYGSAIFSQLIEGFLVLISLVCILVGFGAFVLVMGAPHRAW